MLAVADLRKRALSAGYGGALKNFHFERPKTNFRGFSFFFWGGGKRFSAPPPVMPAGPFSFWWGPAWPSFLVGALQTIF